MTRTLATSPRLLAYAACAGIAVGSLAPWQVSLSATHWGLGQSGTYTLLLALLAALLMIPKPPWPTLVCAIGLFCTAIALLNVIDTAGSTREAHGLAPSSLEVEWGLWLVLLSALALTAAAHAFRREVSPPRRARPERPHGRVETWARANPALFGLLVLLALGLVLRTWLTVAWHPAFIGYSDSGIYFQGAYESLWSDPIRMVGYPIFLRAIHEVSSQLIAVVIVQHLMGLATAALFFFAVRRCGGPSWLGLVPAAVIALGGDQLFLEHAALSDALFIFLIAATLYATVRAADGGIWWGVAAGVLAGLAVWDRTVGLGLVAVIAGWLVFAAGRPTRQRLTVGVATLLVALVTVGIYAGWRSAATDMPGTLTSNNAWNLYGRVAPWADCEEFDPPAGTEALCQVTPASERGYHAGEEYIFSSESPAQRLYGPPYELSSDPAAMEGLQDWSEAAIRGQPLDYLNAVWLDTRRLFNPGAPAYGDQTADGFTAFLLGGVDRSGNNEYVESWQSLLYPGEGAAHHGDIRIFETWEAMTRVVNLWMALLLGLCLVGPWVLTGRPREGLLLFFATALVLIFFPIIAKSYDYRFVIPAFAPLAAGAALSAWGIVVKIRSPGSRSPSTGAAAPGNVGAARVQ